VARSEQSEHDTARLLAQTAGEANFRALLQAAVDAIILIDGDGRILAFNAAAERIFGYPEAEMLGRDVAMLMPEPYCSQHAQYMSRYLRTGERRIIGIGREVEALNRDGEVFPIELAVGQVDTPGPPRFVGIVRDVSARKRAEQETRELQDRLVRVGRFSTMGEMAAGLAHEINQPLSAITTYAQAADRLLEQPVDEERAEEFRLVCRKISDQAHRAGEVIRRLRGFLRLHSSGRARLDCNAMIREIMMLAELDARSNDVPLQIDYADDLPAVYGNAVEIQQVLLNLIRNAVDAMATCADRSRGVIVSTRCLADGSVEISVTDHGPGVDGQISTQVFHPFVSSKPGGLGVGLSLSRTIVQAHGGHLDFHGNPAGGAVFHFTLPPAYDE